MTMIRMRFLFFILFLISLILEIKAQTTYSPYSMIGLGEIENRDYGRTSGMANIGIGVRSFDYLNTSNPAGISGLDSLRNFIFDMSVAGKQSYFSGNGKKDNAFNGNLKRLSFGFRLSSEWGISIGVKPFSDVGYRIYNEEPIDGSSAKKAVYLEGSGGLYELFLMNGLKITDNLSVGVKTKLICGTLKQIENQSEYYFDKVSDVAAFHNTFGVQYYKEGLTLGATYGYKQNITLINRVLVYDDGGNLVRQEKDESIDQFIPATLGVGFSHDSKKITWGMDFQYQSWNGLKSNISSAKIVDSYKVSTGMGYSLNTDSYFGPRNRIQLQIGASVSKSYIQIGGKDAYNYAVTTGCSLPINKGLQQLNFALEYGNSLSAPANYIKESYFMLTVNCTFFEQWFKRKKLE